MSDQPNAETIKNKYCAIFLKTNYQKLKKKKIELNNIFWWLVQNLNILHTYMWRHMDTTLQNPRQLYIWPKKYWTKGRNWSGKSDKAEEYNTLRCSKQANMAKSDWEPITSVTLKNCYRNLKIPFTFKKKVHHHVHKSLPLGSVVSNFNPIDTFTHSFLKICFMHADLPSSLIHLDFTITFFIMQDLRFSWQCLWIFKSSMVCHFS